MEYQLFVSGTPGDYELFPHQGSDTHASQYFKQFFNSPSSENFHSADYYVELFPSEKMAYYTLMHRRNVRSTRNNAYVALSLKFSGCYVDDAKSVFSLLETVYNNYIIGNVIEKSGVEEKYKCQSLASFENMRMKAEAELGSVLSMLGNCVKEFDASFSSKRYPASKQLWYLDENKSKLLQEIKAVQKIHLIPTSDGFEEIVDKANADISNLNTKVYELNKQIGEQSKKIDELNKELASYALIVKEKDNAYAKLLKEYRDLEDHLRNAPKPTPEDAFRSKVLSSLRGIESNVLAVKGQTDALKDNIDNLQNGHFGHKRKPNGNEGNLEIVSADWQKWLPWGLLVVSVVLIAVLGIRLMIPDYSYDDLMKWNDSLQNSYDDLKKSNDSLQNSYNSLQNSYNDLYSNKTEAVTTLPKGVSPFSIGGINDLIFYVDMSYKLNHKPYPPKPNNFKEWKITSGENNAEIHDEYITCKQAGSVTIAEFDINGNKIDGYERTIKIEQK